MLAKTMHWINQNAGPIQAISTVVLAFITAWYLLSKPGTRRNVPEALDYRLGHCQAGTDILSMPEITVSPNIFWSVIELHPGCSDRAEISRVE